MLVYALGLKSFGDASKNAMHGDMFDLTQVKLANPFIRGKTLTFFCEKQPAHALGIESLSLVKMGVRERLILLRSPITAQGREREREIKRD